MTSALADDFPRPWSARLGGAALRSHCAADECRKASIALRNRPAPKGAAHRRYQHRALGVDVEAAKPTKEEAY